MVKRNSFFILATLVVSGSLPVLAQGPKPGLWDVTTKMTWQQSPFPQGSNPGSGGERTAQVCMTQEQIDKLGNAPTNMPHNCRLTNVNKKSDGISADVECDAPFSGKGSFQQTWSDSEHTTGKVHFTGALPNGKPIEWTIDTSSVFKGSDCGDVKPMK